MVENYILTKGTYDLVQEILGLTHVPVRVPTNDFKLYVQRNGNRQGKSLVLLSPAEQRLTVIAKTREGFTEALEKVLTYINGKSLLSHVGVRK
jgi:hypothetical protein